MQMTSGDSICRIFGARLASTADVTRASRAGTASWSVPAVTQHYTRSAGFAGRVVKPASMTPASERGWSDESARVQIATAVHCFGNKPPNLWPFEMGDNESLQPTGPPEL